MILVHYLLGIVQFAIIGYILYSEVEKKSPAMFLWATLLVMFGFPHMITVFTNDLEYSTNSVFCASVFVICFCLLYIVARTRKKTDFLVTDRNGFEIENDNIVNTAYEKVSYIVYLVSIIGVIVSTARSQGGLLNTIWSGAVQSNKSYINLSELAYQLLTTFSGLSLYFFLTKRMEYKQLKLKYFLAR